MVKVARARAEQRRLLLNGADDRCPRDHVVLGQIEVEAWKACSVTHRLADSDRVLTALGELRPVAGDGSIEIEQPLLREHVRADG